MSTAENLSELDPALRALVGELVARQVDERTTALRSEITALTERIQSVEAAAPKDRMTLIVFSNDLDRLMTAFILATGSRAMGLEVTMYLDEDGLVQSVGVGMGDESGHAAVSCIVTNVQTTSFPAPGDNFVKATVRIR